MRKLRLLLAIVGLCFMAPQFTSVAPANAISHPSTTHSSSGSATHCCSHTGSTHVSVTKYGAQAANPVAGRPVRTGAIVTAGSKISTTRTVNIPSGTRVTGTTYTPPGTHVTYRYQPPSYWQTAAMPQPGSPLYRTQLSNPYYAPNFDNPWSPLDHRYDLQPAGYAVQDGYFVPAPHHNTGSGAGKIVLFVFVGIVVLGVLIFVALVVIGSRSKRRGPKQPTPVPGRFIGQ